MTEFLRPTDVSTNSRVAWIYRGVWGVLAAWFRVPEQPPDLPSVAGEPVRSFRPAAGFLRYLLLQSLLGFAALGLMLAGVALAIAVAEPTVGVPLLGLLLPVLALWAAVLILAVHLRFDTTWYVLSDRSLRLRRGIWVIRETTITFENIQNVTVRQGPLQRLFGIADVQVDTAGGGGGAGNQPHGGGGSSHQGLIEGVADAHAIRDLLTAKMRASKSAGLGDESREARPASAGWTAAHVALLREVRDAAATLAGST